MRKMHCEPDLEKSRNPKWSSFAHLGRRPASSKCFKFFEPQELNQIDRAGPLCVSWETNFNRLRMGRWVYKPFPHLLYLFGALVCLKQVVWEKEQGQPWKIADTASPIAHLCELPIKVCQANFIWLPFEQSWWLKPGEHSFSGQVVQSIVKLIYCQSLNCHCTVFPGYHLNYPFLSLNYKLPFVSLPPKIWTFYYK